MSTLLKILLAAVATVVALALGLAGWFYIHGELSRRQAAKDEITESARCDSARYVVEQPTVTFGNFARWDIQKLHFYRLAGNKILQDTLLNREYKPTDDKYAYRLIAIPFTRFAKQETIVVETRNKVFFEITGYHHYAYLHYGMFGYVGGSDCRLSENCVVNGKASSTGLLLAAEGLKNYKLPQQ